MTDVQLYFAIGLPSALALVGILVNVGYFVTISSRIQSFETRLDGRIDALGSRLDARSNSLDGRFDLLMGQGNRNR